MQRRVVAVLVALGLVVGLLVGSAFGGGGETPETLANGPGPNRVVEGIPLGYAPTREGAIAAATNSVVAIGQAIRSKEAMDKVLQYLATSEGHKVIANVYKPGVDVAEESLSGSAGAFRGGVLGHRLTSYGGDRATVDVWVVDVVARATGRAKAGWSTTTVRLGWSGSDWKVEFLTGRNGPTPETTDSPNTGAEVVAAVQDLGEVRYVPVG